MRKHKNDMSTFEYKLILFQISKIHFPTRVDQGVLAIKFFFPVFGTSYSRICITLQIYYVSLMWFLLVKQQP